MKTLKTLSFFFLLTFFSFTCLPLLAQQNAADTIAPVKPPYWQYSGSLGFNFSQVSLTNWAGGGQSSISVGSLVNLGADYAKGKSTWENRLDIAYGLIRQGDNEQANLRKTDDIINLLSKYNYHLIENFYASALVDFRTQMDEGYEFEEINGETQRTRISDFMAPGFLLTSLGVTYKKAEEFSLTLSPFTGKFTFVLDDSLSSVGAFGLEPNQQIRSELGALLRAVYQKDVFTNINYRSSLNLFGNYETFSHIDINWENMLVMKVNKYINSTVSSQLIYDHDVIQKAQWRNIINVGFLLTI
jgi:hypothetical protein